jgi:arylformamidase
MAASTWMDVSVPLRTGIVHWPGDPEPTFERISELEQGADANVTLCRMTAHTGTHMDAPAHFLPGHVPGIDAFPVDIGIGPARVVRVDAPVITRAEVEPLNPQPGERLLFRTKNSSSPWVDTDFQTGYVGLDASAAELLAERKIVLVGVDYLSVGVYKGDGAETHRTLLSAGIWIVEGLELTRVEPGNYEMVCLPLRIVGADGSPARVVLRPVA